MIGLPKRISTQLLLLLMGASIVFQVCVTLLQAQHPSDMLKDPSNPELLPLQMQALVLNVKALSMIAPKDRARYLAEANAISVEHLIGLLPAATPAPTDQVDPHVARQLLPRLPAGTRLAASSSGLLQIRLPDGLVVQVKQTDFTPTAPWTGFLITTLVLTFGCGLFYVAYAYFSLKRPLSLFAVAVERFGIDQSSGSVSEKGPLEVAAVARVFNRMQERIRVMIADRTRTLAALSHDLRTPITRLRLRADKVRDPSLREAMIRDLDYMQRMAHAALTFLRDDTPAPKAPIDVASLLQTICDEAVEIGHPVAYAGPEHLIAVVRIDELRRAVTNLVGNAVFQEANVVIALRACDPCAIEVDVVDDGPGIPDADKGVVFEPFRRGPRSASDRNGFGLGLSIVANVVHSHGGEVSLHDRPGGGLICRLRLPRGETTSRPAILDPRRATNSSTFDVTPSEPA